MRIFLIAAAKVVLSAATRKKSALRSRYALVTILLKPRVVFVRATCRNERNHVWQNKNHVSQNKCHVSLAKLTPLPYLCTKFRNA